ncbi:MAG: hypothetical protein ACI9VR_002164 [Cognaticolwellia sp.]|jgi:hypothetical protein
MLLLFTTLFACHGVDLLGAMSPMGEPYMEGMWEARALTLQAGLVEAENMHAEGEHDAAQQMVRDVYQGSFEPELEVLVREQGSRALAAELEYSFGLLERAMGQRDSERVAKLRSEIEAGVFAQAQGFDTQKLVLR